MCGRYTLTSSEDIIGDMFDVDTHAAILPRFNIAPAQPVLIVRKSPKGERELAAVEWGLVPEWKKELSAGKPLINARAETVAEKASFRSPFKRTRCLVPFNGWYEWKTRAGVKHPYLIEPVGGGIHAFAGIWTVWHGVGAENWLETMAIITEEAVGPMRAVHHRRPLVVAANDYERWLSPTDPVPRNFIEETKFLTEAEFHWHEVSRRINDVRYDAPDCLDLPAEDKQTSFL